MLGDLPIFIYIVCIFIASNGVHMKISICVWGNLIASWKEMKMIENDKQYQSAKEWVETFEKEANNFSDDSLGRMFKEDYESQAELLKKEMEVYKNKSNPSP